MTPQKFDPGCNSNKQLVCMKKKETRTGNGITNESLSAPLSNILLTPGALLHSLACLISPPGKEKKRLLRRLTKEQTIKPFQCATSLY